jgi:hypothetical protein
VGTTMCLSPDPIRDRPCRHDTRVGYASAYRRVAAVQICPVGNV